MILCFVIRIFSYKFAENCQRRMVDPQCANLGFAPEFDASTFCSACKNKVHVVKRLNDLETRVKNNQCVSFDPNRVDDLKKRWNDTRSRRARILRMRSAEHMH